MILANTLLKRHTELPSNVGASRTHHTVAITWIAKSPIRCSNDFDRRLELGFIVDTTWVLASLLEDHARSDVLPFRATCTSVPVALWALWSVWRLWLISVSTAALSRSDCCKAFSRSRRRAALRRVRLLERSSPERLSDLTRP